MEPKMHIQNQNFGVIEVKKHFMIYNGHAPKYSLTLLPDVNASIMPEPCSDCT